MKTYRFKLSNDFKIILIGVMCFIFGITYYTNKTINQLHEQKLVDIKVLEYQNILKKEIGRPQSYKRATAVEIGMESQLSNQDQVKSELAIISQYYNVSFMQNDTGYLITGSLYNIISVINQILFLNITIEIAAIEIHANKAKLLLLNRDLV